MILGSISDHTQLWKLDENGNEKMIFLMNTVDDVLIDENGNSLSPYIASLDDDLENPTKKEALGALALQNEGITYENLEILMNL